MHPILFRVGSYEVPSYGVALALAFAVGIALARRRARGAGLDEDAVIDTCMVILVASIVGARALWVVTHLEWFQPPRGTFLDAVNPFGGGGFRIAGLSMWGGVALAVVASLSWLAWRRQPVLAMADVLAPSVALGEGITRIGCFLNGCCFGHACDAAFCLAFPPGSGAHAVFGGSTVHPTQLYASALGFAGFAVLAALWRRRPFDGAVLCAFLVWVGAQRFLLDFVRYAEASTLASLGPLSVTVSQLFGLAALAAGVAGLAWLVRHAPGREAAGH